MSSNSTPEAQRRWRNRNKERINEHRRKWRLDFTNRRCDCGEPAAHCKGSDFICERCFQEEQARKANESRRERCGLGATMPVHVLHLANL